MITVIAAMIAAALGFSRLAPRPTVPGREASNRTLVLSYPSCRPAARIASGTNIDAGLSRVRDRSPP